MSVRLALVGAGHAHLLLLRQAVLFRASGVSPVLIAPAVFRYSGMASGVLSGALEAAEAEVDVAALARAAGVEHRPVLATDVDLARRELTLADGKTIAFDLLSLNVGSVVDDRHGLASQGPNVWRVKPLAELDGLRRRLEDDAAARGRCPGVVIAGSGLTAFEIAAALAGRCERLGAVPDIVLVGPDPHAGWAPPGAAVALMASLRARGVRVLEGEVTAREEGACCLASGEALACDHLVLATGLAAPPLVSALGLPVDSVGRLRTTPTLQSIANAAVFATGDCAVIEETPRPCAGVFGVRAAPVLGANIRAWAQGRRLRRYRPQARWLAVMDLGETRALAMRGRLWAFAPWALRLKRWLDRRFVRCSRSPL